MNWWESTILGIVQGVTEWLPISSDGHLVLFEKLLGLSVAISFDVFLHLSSLLVIVIFFRKEILDFLKNLFGRPNTWPAEQNKWWQYLLISTLITGAIGLAFYPYIESYRNLSFTAYGFLLTSFMVLSSRWGKATRTIGYREAVLLGIVQGLAVLPGVSRSGLVLSLALLMGVYRKQAFDYTFFLAVPAIAAAFLLSVKDFVWQPIYLLGFAVTVAVGLATLSLLKKIVNNDKFYLFFVYTLALFFIIKFILL